MHKYKKQHEVCEICKERKPLEVHHIVPLSEGGKNDFDNFIALCGKCHVLIHEKDKTTLTKLGIIKRKCDWEDFEKNPSKYEQTALINLIDIYKWAEDRNYEFDVVELFEFLAKIRIYKNSIKLKNK